MEEWEADDARRQHMARFRRRDTAPELALRRELHHRGRRFFVDRPVSSRCRVRPDLVFPRARIAVFVDGCFWHYCEEHAHLPKANADLWRRKLLANRQRDARNEAILTSEGWRVLRFWEHVTPEQAATTVEHALDRWAAITRATAMMPGSMGRMIEVVAAVLTRPDGRVLACRRAPGRSAAGLWEFPGGKVELGERAEGALRRELNEELGVDAIIGEHIDRSVTRVGDAEIDLATYRVPWAEAGPISSTDHDELRWVRPADLADLGWAPPDLPTVRILSAAVATA